jgi:adenylate kinase family enzyme
MSMPSNKILVIGASGSGKSTFAKKVAEKLNLTYIPTDPFYWDQDWQLVPDYVVRNRVMEVLQYPD